MDTTQGSLFASFCQWLPPQMKTAEQRLIPRNFRDAWYMSNFVVEYNKAVVCIDGVLRKKVFYQCRSRKNVAEGSAEHEAGHRLAEARAWVAAKKKELGMD